MHGPLRAHTLTGGVGHSVCIADTVDKLLQALRVEVDVHVERLGALIQPREVLLEEYEHTLVEPQALPDTVPKHEAAVQH